MSAPAELNDTLTGLASVLGELAASVVEPVLTARKLGFGTFDLLAAVHAAEGRETQGQIAQRMGIAPASLTEAVKSAVKRGLVDQLVVANNKRSRRIMLTTEGDAVLRECLARLTQAEAMAVEGLTDQEQELARAVLRRANANLHRFLNVD